MCAWESLELLLLQQQGCIIRVISEVDCLKVYLTSDLQQNVCFGAQKDTCEVMVAITLYRFLWASKILELQRNAITSLLIKRPSPRRTRKKDKIACIYCILPNQY